MSERVSSLGDLGDFAPVPVKQKPTIDEKAVIEQVAKEKIFQTDSP